MKCPKCGSDSRVYRSKRDAALIYRLFGWHRFRCVNCNLYIEGFAPISVFTKHKRPEPSSAPSAVVTSATSAPLSSERQPSKKYHHRALNASERCPECGASDVRRSRRRGLIERTIYTLRGLMPYRCFECEHRYYRKSDAAKWQKNVRDKA